MYTFPRARCAQRSPRSPLKCVLLLSPPYLAKILSCARAYNFLMRNLYVALGCSLTCLSLWKRGARRRRVERRERIVRPPTRCGLAQVCYETPTPRYTPGGTRIEEDLTLGYGRIRWSTCRSLTKRDWSLWEAQRTEGGVGLWRTYCFDVLFPLDIVSFTAKKMTRCRRRKTLFMGSGCTVLYCIVL